MYQNITRPNQQMFLSGEEQSIQFSNLINFYAITEEAFRIALGMNWESEDIKSALDYFKAYFESEDTVI